MDVLDAIFTRRSIRAFTGEPIKEDDLKIILKAGFQAPSANNLQPRDYIVIRAEKAIEDVVAVHPYARMLKQAGCGIIVCGDQEKQSRLGFLLEDCSAAIQNILLAVHGMGLGAVWCGLYPNTQLTEPISKVLSLPEKIIPVGLIVLGHKAVEVAPVDRYDETKMHFDKW